MKKIFTLLLFFIFASPIFAKNFSFDLLNFSIEPFVQFHNGSQKEYVYLDEDYDNESKLSELNWEEKNIYFLGINSDVSYKNFILGFSYQQTIPSYCGMIYDYDWLNKVSESTDKKYHYLKTNYSEHYNFLEYYYSLCFDFKYNFNLSKLIDISPSLSYEFLSLKFNAINGFYRYGVKNEYGNYIENYQTGTITYIDGDVLSLTRNLNIIWFGFSTNFSATKKLDFIASFQICPFIYVDSIDFHVTRHSYFYDRMYGFFKGIQFEIKSYYNFTNNHSLALSFKFRNLSDINGDTYSGSDLNETFVKNTSKSGSAFNFINLSLSYRYRFK